MYSLFWFYSRTASSRHLCPEDIQKMGKGNKETKQNKTKKERETTKDRSAFLVRGIPWPGVGGTSPGVKDCKTARGQRHGTGKGLCVFLMRQERILLHACNYFSVTYWGPRLGLTVESCNPPKKKYWLDCFNFD